MERTFVDSQPIAGTRAGMNPPKTSPEVVVCDDPDAAACYVADFFASAVRRDRAVVLGLATGGTPVGVYRELVKQYRAGKLDFSQMTSFNLDEYVGLAAQHPQSFRYFMQQHLFDHLNVVAERTHVPDGTADDLQRHAEQYEMEIRDSGGIDLQLLGIGSNGHIAFNEPGSPLDSRTRVVELTDETIEANARFFDSADQVPRRAITMGIGTILEAKRIVLMATGESKAEAVADAIGGRCDPRNPASALQLHSDVVFVLDRSAASQID